MVNPGSRWELVKEGLAYVWNQKIVFGAISLDLFAVLLGGATALLPVFARDILHVGPLGLGFLRSAPALGAFAVAFWLTGHTKAIPDGLDEARALLTNGAVKKKIADTRAFFRS